MTGASAARVASIRSSVCSTTGSPLTRERAICATVYSSSPRALSPSPAC